MVSDSRPHRTLANPAIGRMPLSCRLNDSALRQTFGHLCTRLRAVAARLHAFVHVTDSLAIIRASATDLRAYAACEMMQIGATEHEIRTRLADLGTVHHQPEMLRFEMFPTGLQTMVHRRLVADVMTAQAEPDALFHFRIHVMHGSFPRLRWVWVRFTERVASRRSALESVRKCPEPCLRFA
jgi:hypothetical protein